MHSLTLSQKLLAPLMLLGCLTLAACNNAKSPDDVAKDVSKAEEKASKMTADSEAHAEKDLNKAADKVDDKLVDFNNAAAKDAYNIAITKAEGDRKVALAACEAKSGDAQKNCKTQADADYEAVKASAKAEATAVKQ